MILAISIVALLCLLSLGIVAFAAVNPPEGFEDENGFHLGSESTPAPPRWKSRRFRLRFVQARPVVSGEFRAA